MAFSIVSPYHLGERVANNAVVAIVQADRLPYARVYVPATHRAAFVVGQTVTVHVDGIKDQYQGKIRWVANEPSFTHLLCVNRKRALTFDVFGRSGSA